MENDIRFSAAVLAAFVGGCILLGYLFTSYQCDNLSLITGKPTKYDFVSGCFVKIDGNWVPEERWRVSP